jgi:hypothetical protein
MFGRFILCPGGAQRYDFEVETNNDGNIVVNVGADNFTLTGNPIPKCVACKCIFC